MDRLSFALGLIFPFAIVAATNARYTPDIDVFIRWANDLAAPGGLHYRDGTNYPAIGVLLSGGALHLIRKVLRVAGDEQLRQLFRYYLAIFDVTHFLLLGVIGGRLGIRKPWIAAFCIMAIPSTWAGASVWGQLEGATQTFLFASVASCAIFWEKLSSDRFGAALGWAGLALISALSAFFTKQLSMFSMPWMALTLLLCSIQAGARWRIRGIAGAAVVSGVVLGVFTFIDRIFATPPGFYGSGLMWIWLGGGSDHGDKISGNGFNVWMLLGRNMGSSPLVPFGTLDPFGIRIDLNPHDVGNVLFLVASGAILVLFVRALGGLRGVRSLIGSCSRASSVRVLLLLLYAAGLDNLAAAVFLAGTHERHLYHGYPLLLLPCLRLWQRPRWFGWRFVAALLLAAIAYGCFVFSFIGPIPFFLFPFKRHEFMATIHLLLFWILVEGFWSLGSRLRTEGELPFS